MSGDSDSRADELLVVRSVRESVQALQFMLKSLGEDLVVIGGNYAELTKVNRSWTRVFEAASAPRPAAPTQL